MTGGLRSNAASAYRIKRKDFTMHKIRFNAIGACAVAFAFLPFALAGCASSPEQVDAAATSAADTGAARVSGASTSAADAQDAISSVDDMPDVTVRFGQGGASFTFVPEKNDTALALVRNVTESGRNLPIYAYEGFEGDDVMQYYDVPSRYDIPSNPVRTTSEQAGEVYLSGTDRVILFYRDAQVEGDFTYVGRIDDASGLAEAVVENPVVQGYSNKIIAVAYAE